MQGACTFLKTGTYLPNCVTKHNSKWIWIFMFSAHANFVNYSKDESDFFLRNIGSNLPDYSYDLGNHRKK